MKKVVNILMLLLLAVPSCRKKFLEKPITSDVTIDIIFGDKLKAEQFLWEVYNTCVPQGFPMTWDNTGRDGLYASMMASACDEGDMETIWVGSNQFNTGSWGPGSCNFEDQFANNCYAWTHWKGIRNANILLENIDKVPNATDDEKAKYKAEAKVLRSLQFFELVKRYGGVPVVDHVLDVSGEMKIPRSTFEECVQFMINDCDEAAAVLPNSYASEFVGRITKGAALALKGKVLLYAASPLFNSNEPYMGMDDNLKKITGYGNYKQERWKEAADANEAVLNWATSAGVALVKTGNPAADYEEAVTGPNNTELILVRQTRDWAAAEQADYRAHKFLMPRNFYTSTMGVGITLPQLTKYYKADGTDQTWSQSGAYAEYKQKMAEMEPRFQASAFWSGSKFNDELGVVDYYKRADGSNTSQYPMNGVAYMKKFLTRFRAATGSGFIHWRIFRLAEFYLNYAEALNEYSPLDPKTYQALNAIRRRAGLPDVTPADARYDSQQELREAIRRERAIELFAEEHRFFDVRRWKIAEQTEKGQMWGFTLQEQTPNNISSITYSGVAFETRVFEPKMYLYPFPDAEINKGYLVQNPGW